MYNGTDHTAGWDNSGGAGHTHTVSSTGMLDTGQYTHVSGHTACTPSVNTRLHCNVTEEALKAETLSSTH